MNVISHRAAGAFFGAWAACAGSLPAWAADGSTLVSLSPASAVAGAPGLVLTVRGSGFLPRSVVRWNLSLRPTQYVSQGELRAAITAADVARAREVTVGVVHPRPGPPSNLLVFTVENPLPTLGPLSPSSRVAGGAGFTLTLRGSGFVPRRRQSREGGPGGPSVVRWNGADRPTRYVSGSELTAAIPASDMTAAGTAQVTVFNPLPGGGTSDARPFTKVDSGTPLTVQMSLFAVDDGPPVPDPDELTLGTPLSVNDDDDDGDGRPDASDAVLNGGEDRRDSARVRLDVQPWDKVSGTIQLSAVGASLIRVFDDQDQPVSLPETLLAARFGTGAIDYRVEGLAAGSATLTLALTEGPQQDQARLLVGQQTGIQLTFDDGPDATDPGVETNLSKLVVDTLGANPVKNGILATFFVQTHVPFRGGAVTGQDRIAAEGAAGHHVEVHTGSTDEHVDHTVRVAEPPHDASGDGTVGPEDGENGLESDLIRAKERIRLLTGRMPLLVRPPYGALNPAVTDTYARQGLTLSLWDVDSGDTTACASATTNACMSARLRAEVQGKIDAGSTEIVLLFHDVKVMTAENVAVFLKVLEDAVQHRGRNARFDLVPVTAAPSEEPAHNATMASASADTAARLAAASAQARHASPEARAAARAFILDTESAARAGAFGGLHTSGALRLADIDRALFEAGDAESRRRLLARLLESPVADEKLAIIAMLARRPGVEGSKALLTLCERPREDAFVRLQAAKAAMRSGAPRERLVAVLEDLRERIAPEFRDEVNALLRRW